MAKFDNLKYSLTWRPNYELYQVLVMLSGALFYLLYGFFNPGVQTPVMIIASIFVLFAMIKIPAAYKVWQRQSLLAGHDLNFVPIEKVRQFVLSKKHPDVCWLGYGFKWMPRHTQELCEALKRNWAEFGRTPKGILQTLAFKDAEVISEHVGQTWIHGLEPKESKILQKLSHMDGHTMIFGTTGSGKTRFFDLLITQAICQGDSIIILDPKGDIDLMNNAKRSCEALGRADAFVKFHLAHLDDSSRINPLANWSNATEVPSRVSSIMPTTGSSAPFTNFAWSAMNSIVHAMVLCGDRPTLKRLRAYIEGGVETLTARSIIMWMKTVYKENAQKVIDEVVKDFRPNSKKYTERLVSHYKTAMRLKHHSTVLDGIIDLLEHDAEHYSKMITSLLPILNKLTSGRLGDALSPPNEEEAALHEYRDFGEMIGKGCVVYVGLDMLSNAEVGGALGAMFIADLTAVAGSIYNFQSKNCRRIDVFVDEANEIANDGFIQLLNKGRGANFRLFVATQTFADFSVRTGSSSKATQVFGNLNNIFTLRSQDPETQKFFCARMPKTKIRYVAQDQGQSTLVHEPILMGGSTGERLVEEESELVPPEVLGLLPNLEYFGVISGGYVVKGRVPILYSEEEKDRIKF